jgi:glutathione peroxidase
VNGFNTAPVYKFLKSSKSAGLFGNDNIKWNFTKFLLDKNGQVVQRYESGVSPLQIEVCYVSNLNALCFLSFS